MTCATTTTNRATHPSRQCRARRSSSGPRPPRGRCQARRRPFIVVVVHAGGGAWAVEIHRPLDAGVRWASSSAARAPPCPDDADGRGRFTSAPPSHCDRPDGAKHGSDDKTRRPSDTGRRDGDRSPHAHTHTHALFVLSGLSHIPEWPPSLPTNTHTHTQTHTSLSRAHLDDLLSLLIHTHTHTTHTLVSLSRTWTTSFAEIRSFFSTSMCWKTGQSSDCISDFCCVSIAACSSLSETTPVPSRSSVWRTHTTHREGEGGVEERRSGGASKRRTVVTSGGVTSSSRW